MACVFLLLFNCQTTVKFRESEAIFCIYKFAAMPLLYAYKFAVRIIFTF